MLTLLAVLTYTTIQAYQTHLIYSNNIISQRAFVYIDRPTLANNAVVFPLANSGNTPTKNLAVYIRCAPSAEDIPEPWVLLYRGPPEQAPGFIGPHAIVTTWCAFTPGETKQIAEKTLYGYLLGDITYNDQLDWSSAHRTQFSVKIVDIASDTNGNITRMRTINVGRHNCADDECPPN